jgi:hypothetical protein
LQKLLSPLKSSDNKNGVEFYQNGAEVLKNHKNLECRIMLEKKSMKIEFMEISKTLKTEHFKAKIGGDTAENEPRNGSKRMYALKDPVSDRRRIAHQLKRRAQI